MRLTALILGVMIGITVAVPMDSFQSLERRQGACSTVSHHAVYSKYFMTVVG
jgi:hypothetical protein